MIRSVYRSTMLRHWPGFVVLAAASLVPFAAAAQVSVDQGALQGLGTPAPAAKPAPASKPAPTGHRRPAQHGHAAGKPAPKVKPAAPPVIRAAPPPPAAIPPAVPVPPAHPAPPPPPVPVSPDAPGSASTTPDGLRITFGPDRSDLNAGEISAIRAAADSLKDDASAAIALDAFAAGSPDDPSTPRRLSLSRGLSVRAVLISQGVASNRIFVRALGATGAGDGPIDRVDLTRTTRAGHAVSAPAPVQVNPVPAPP